MVYLDRLITHIEVYFIYAQKIKMKFILIFHLNAIVSIQSFRSGKQLLPQ